jgi:hypothetical protein
MTQLLITLALVAVPFALLAAPALAFWNEHDRKGAVGYTALVAVGVLVWQWAWRAAG